MSRSELLIPDEFAEHGVEFLCRGGIAGYIVPMPVKHIEIHKVHKAYSAEIPLLHIEQQRFALRIALCRVAFGYAAPGKNVVYLAYGYNVKSVLL